MMKSLGFVGVSYIVKTFAVPVVYVYEASAAVSWNPTLRAPASAITKDANK